MAPESPVTQLFCNERHGNTERRLDSIETKVDKIVDTLHPMNGGKERKAPLIVSIEKGFLLDAGKKILPWVLGLLGTLGTGVLAYLGITGGG